MATRDVSIRISVTEGDKVRKELTLTGEEGQRALKKIEEAAKPASKELVLFNAAGELAHDKFRELSSEAGSLGTFLTRLGPAGLAAAAAIGGIALAAHHAVEEAEKFEQQQRKLEAVLNATNFAAGQTKAQLTELAESYAHTTLYTGEQVQQAEAILLTYRRIHSDIFDDALKATLNISTLFDNDLTASARAVGRALEDPAEGLAAITKKGAALDPIVKQNIENLAKMGHEAEAQKMVLDALANSVGGQAAAQNQGLTGATHQLSVAFGELSRAVGQNIEDTGILQGVFSGLTKVVRGLREEVRATASEELVQLNQRIDMMNKSGTRYLLPGGYLEDPGYQKLLDRRQKLLDEVAQEEKDKEVAQNKEKEAIRKDHAAALLAIENDLSQKLKEATQTEQQKIIDDTRQLKEKIRAQLLPDGSNKADIEKEIALANRLQSAKLSKVNQKEDDKAEQTREQAIKKINEEILRTKPSFDVAKQALDNWKQGLIDDLGGATAENQKYIELIDKIYTVRLKEIYNKSLQDSNDWAAGAARALSKYADEATNAAKNSERVFSNAAKGIEDTIVSAVNTGKISMKSLGDTVQSIEQDILRSFVRQNITGPIAGGLSSLLGGGPGGAGSGGGGIFGNLFSGIFGGGQSSLPWLNQGASSGGFFSSIGSWFSGLFHEGGVVGSSMVQHRSVPAFAFAGAPRLHTGLMPDEFPAILQRGETVLPKGKKASGGMNVTFNISTPNAQSFMDSRGQMLSKFAGEMQRVRTRNG